MRFCMTMLVAVALTAGCDVRRLTAPSVRPQTAARSGAVAAEVSCRPGGELYGVRIQGFPESSDTTIYELHGDLGAYFEAGGPIGHPLVHAERCFVGTTSNADTCSWGAVAQLAGRFAIFPDKKFSRWRLTGTWAETDLGRGYYECDWVSIFETFGSLEWGGEKLPWPVERNTVFRKDPWRLVLNEQDLASEWPTVNMIHLYGPGGRQVIVSHIQAIPICP